MRQCGLRASFSTIAEADRWVIHDPRAWLGTAFHTVMATVRRTGAKDEAVTLWDKAISEALEKAIAHPLDTRFFVKERWPNYYFMRQRCLSSASQITVPRAPAVTPSSNTEKRFEARGGKLTGIPDHYRSGVITEYKSTLPDPAWSGAASLLEAYKRQVFLYAAIIHEVFGNWPSRGVIAGASGQTIDITITPEECDAEADAAVEALDAFNKALSSANSPVELANPSPQACGTCPYQLLCPAFWASLSANFFGDIPNHAAQGQLVKIDSGNDGDIYHLHLAACAGSKPLEDSQVLTLRNSIHGKPAQEAAGQTCLITNVIIRDDQRLRADIQTLIVMKSELPSLHLHT